MGTVYDEVGGYERLRALAAAWHERCLDDEIMNHPFSHPGAHDHLDRLASYWAEQLGGPSLYTGRYGDETSVVRRHAGNGEHLEMDERAVACFAQALDDIGVDEGVLRSELLTWFAHETGQLARYPGSPDDVPDDLPLRVWGGAPS